MKKPYKLHVVLHLADNRLLTDVFRDRVERELRDSLRAALGELAEVNVTRQHGRLAEVLNKGLRSLDGWKERSDVKTHFVLIDFSGVHYEIQARQYDGMTGVATPVVRRERTQDREFVARTAALLIERDFGLIATFPSWPRGGKKPQAVRLEIKGGGLDAPLSRWVNKGDVFAVVRVPTGGGGGLLIPWALVQVETPPDDTAHDGVCAVKLFWRYDLPADGPGVAGYRCLKLGAVRGPLHVRLMRAGPDGSLRPLDAQKPMLYVRHEGFVGEDATRLQLDSDPNLAGAYDTLKLDDKGLFDRVAFVAVRQGGSVRPAEIPVAILDDQPVIVPVTVTDNDTTLADLRKRAWRLSVSESYAVQANVFKELAEMSAKKDGRARVIEAAREAVKRSEEDLGRLMPEREALYGAGQKLTDADRRDLAQADKSLKAIREGGQELTRFLAQQEKIDKEENSPERKRWLEQVERGKLLEQDGELGKAIVVYGAVLDEGFKNEELEAHLKKLRQRWAPKSPAHEKAHEFIYEVWPTLDTAGLQERMKEAYAALEECRKAGDFVRPRKLGKGIQIHLARMLKEAEGLRDINVEDEKQLKLIKEVSAELGKLDGEINALLKKALG